VVRGLDVVATVSTDFMGLGYMYTVKDGFLQVKQRSEKSARFVV
jgi:hypothetical protein